MFSFSSLLAAVAVPLAVSAALPVTALATAPDDCVMLCQPPTEQANPDDCVMLCQPPTEQDGGPGDCVMLCEPDRPRQDPFPPVPLMPTGLGEA